MINILEEISYWLDQREWKKRQEEKGLKEKKKGHCPDCGFLVACDRCSKNYDLMDEYLYEQQRFK